MNIILSEVQILGWNACVCMGTVLVAGGAASLISELAHGILGVEPDREVLSKAFEESVLPIDNTSFWIQATALTISVAAAYYFGFSFIEAPTTFFLQVCTSAFEWISFANILYPRLSSIFSLGFSEDDIGSLVLGSLFGLLFDGVLEDPLFASAMYTALYLEVMTNGIVWTMGGISSLFIPIAKQIQSLDGKDDFFPISLAWVIWQINLFSSKKERTEFAGALAKKLTTLDHKVVDEQQKEIQDSVQTILSWIFCPDNPSTPFLKTQYKNWCRVHHPDKQGEDVGLFQAVGRLMELAGDTIEVPNPTGEYKTPLLMNV